MRKTLLFALLTSAFITFSSSTSAPKPPLTINVPFVHSFVSNGCTITIESEFQFVFDDNYRLIRMNIVKTFNVVIDCGYSGSHWARPGTDAEFEIKDGYIRDVILHATGTEDLDKLYANPDFKSNLLKVARDSQPQGK